MPSLLPPLSPSTSWGSRGGTSTTTPVTRQPPYAWDASALGSSSSVDARWEAGRAYAQLQHGSASGAQSGSAYLRHAHDPRSDSSIESDQARQVRPGLGEGAASSSSIGPYFPSIEHPRGGANLQSGSQDMDREEQQDSRHSQLDAQPHSRLTRQGDDAELLDAFPTYPSTSASSIQMDPLSQRTIGAGGRSQSSSSGGWAVQGQRRGVMPEMGLVGTSILPGGALGSVPLQPPPQYDQRRWSHDQSAIHWSGSSSSTGVNFHSLGPGGQHQPLAPLSTSSYPVRPISSVPPLVSASSSNSFSRSRSGSRSISSASFSDSPGSLPVSPVPGQLPHATKSFSAISDASQQNTGPHVGGKTKTSGGKPEDLPMGVPSGLGR